MNISLRNVSAHNWYACTKLKVKAEQQAVFPVPVVYWIAESKYEDHFELRAVYLGEEPVGFTVFCSEADVDGNHWIMTLMINEKHQGQGYGRAAMKMLIEQLRLMKAKWVMIGHRPNNEVAGRLYESLGFNKISEELIDGEIVRCLSLS